VRILIVIHAYPPASIGGSELYAEVLARALAAQGDVVHVVTRESDRMRPEYGVRAETRGAVTIHWINNLFASVTDFADSYESPRIAAVARRIVDEFRPDVAHVHHLTCLSTRIVHELAARRVPIVFTLHDYWLLCHRGQLLTPSLQVCDGPDAAGCGVCLGATGGAGRGAFSASAALHVVESHLPSAAAAGLRRAATRVAAAVLPERDTRPAERARLAHMTDVMSRVTQFLAPSISIRDRFVRAGVPEARIDHQPYGIDVGAFDRARDSPRARNAGEPLRVGFIGSLMVSKGPAILLDAAAMLSEGRVAVDVFGAHTAYHGDDSYRAQLEPKLSRAGVRWHGPLPHERLADTLATLDALVVPSIWPENSPFVALEAIAAGVPVVASRIGGLPEIVRDGVNGRLFEPGSAADLTRVLGELTSGDRLELLRRGAGRSAGELTTIDTDVRTTRALYARLVESGPQAKGAHEPAISTTVPAAGATRSSRLAAVVLNYRQPDDTVIAVRSLLASNRAIDDLIVVDNGANDEALRARLAKMRAPVRYLATGANLGFPGGMNVGIRAALEHGAGRVLLVNSDVFVPPDCVAALERALAQAPNGGIAGPVVYARSAPDTIASIGLRYDPRTGRIRHESADSPPGEARHLVPSGCLLLVERRVFETIGVLDEAYFLSFEDLDFCLRAMRAGFGVVCSPDARVLHEGGATIRDDSADRLYYAARNHLRFARDSAPHVTAARRSVRTASIIALNVAHALRSRGGSLPARLGAVTRGTRDYFNGTFGEIDR